MAHTVVSVHVVDWVQIVKTLSHAMDYHIMIVTYALETVLATMMVLVPVMHVIVEQTVILLMPSSVTVFQNSIEMYVLEEVPVVQTYSQDSNQLVSSLENVTVIVHIKETIVKNNPIAVLMVVSMENVMHMVQWNLVLDSVNVKIYSGAKIVANLLHALNHAKTVEDA
jgi:hypothetical protein